MHCVCSWLAPVQLLKGMVESPDPWASYVAGVLNIPVDTWAQSIPRRLRQSRTPVLGLIFCPLLVLPALMLACILLPLPWHPPFLRYERGMGCMALGKLLTLSGPSYQCQVSYGFLRGSAEPQTPDGDCG